MRKGVYVVGPVAELLAQSCLETLRLDELNLANVPGRDGGPYQADL